MSSTINGYSSLINIVKDKIPHRFLSGLRYFNGVTVILVSGVLAIAQLISSRMGNGVDVSALNSLLVSLSEIQR